jgi:Kef-type K+ transport system membrane component KefB
MAYTDYVSVEQIGPNFYQVDTVPGFPLGQTVEGKSPTTGLSCEFVYLKGVTNCVEGSFVTYREKDYTAVLLAANAIGSVAIAMAAVDAATKYGWFQIRGRAVGKVAASYADNALVYATATAGTADDAVVAGDRVKLARSSSAIDTPVTGFAWIDINYPFMDDASAA